MKKEFNLSDKWEYSEDRFRVYPEKDIKEFIKILKEELYCSEGAWPYIEATIDKLAGADLI